jgi:hypothetical protein
MKSILLLVAFFCVTPMLAWTQDTSRRFTYELSGTLTYSYSSSSSDLQLGNISYTVGPRVHAGSIQPALGLMLSHDWQLQILLKDEFEVRQQPNIMFKYVSPNVYEYTEYDVPSSSNSPGFSFGINYSLHVSFSVEIFLGSNVGLGWTASSYDYSPVKWSKPEITFPSFDLGARLFVGRDWAIRPLVEYHSISNYLGIDGFSNSTISIGVGLATYF